MSSEVESTDIGIVTAVNGRKVTVELERGGGCKSCAMQGMCFSKGKPAVFELETDLILVPGDRVTIEVSPRTRIISSLLIFLMPVVFLFIGYMVAAKFLTELASIGIGFLAMAGSFMIVRIVDKRMGNHLDIRLGAKV